MKLADPLLRDRLASEYVLGTLQGRARARLLSRMRYDPDLRERVARWEAQLAPLADTVPAVTPPARVWQAVERRIGGSRPAAGWWRSLAVWRSVAALGAVLSITLAILLTLTTGQEARMSMVTVLSDAAGRPALLVTWPPMAGLPEPRLRVRIVQDHPTMPSTSSWELWLLPGAGARPVSLGLVSLDPLQVMKVPAGMAAELERAWGLALSLEPAGGSPTGAPTGPVIFQGQCLKML